MNTYSESGGISDNFLNLLFAGILSDIIPIPIPQGASFMYLAIATLFMSRTVADASSFLNADLILLICWLLLPILVKIRIIKKKAPTMALGISIFIDLAKNKKTIKPAINVIIADLVPDWNIPHMTAAVVNKKNILSIFNFDVIPKTKNATADALALHP